MGSKVDHNAPDRCELCAKWERRQLDWGRCGFDGRTTYGHAPCSARVRGEEAFERRAR